MVWRSWGERWRRRSMAAPRAGGALAAASGSTHHPMTVPADQSTISSAQIVATSTSIDAASLVAGDRPSSVAGELHRSGGGSARAGQQRDLCRPGRRGSRPQHRYSIRNGAGRRVVHRVTGPNRDGVCGLFQRTHRHRLPGCRSQQTGARTLMFGPAAACRPWQRLVDQPWRIMSIGLREWAHRF